MRTHGRNRGWQGPAIINFLRYITPPVQTIHAPRPAESSIPLWNLWWLTVRRLNDPPGAEHAARILVTLQPDYAHAAHALAWSLVMRRRFAELLPAESSLKR